MFLQRFPGPSAATRTVARALTAVAVSCVLVGVAAIAAATTTTSVPSPSDDRWSYPFGSFGARATGSLFVTPPGSGFDYRDGEIILRFRPEGSNTASENYIPRGLNPAQYDFAQANVVVHHDISSTPTWNLANPAINSAGEPLRLEIWGAGFHTNSPRGTTADSWTENSPFEGANPLSPTKVARNPYPMSLEDPPTTATAVNRIGAAAWGYGSHALGTAAGEYTPGVRPLAPFPVTFSLNTNHPKVRGYIQRGLAAGRIDWILASTAEPVPMQLGPIIPNFLMKENSVGAPPPAFNLVNLTIDPLEAGFRQFDAPGSTWNAIRPDGFHKPLVINHSSYITLYANGDTTNTFGFTNSPLFRVAPAGAMADSPFALYKSTYRISSAVSSRPATPDLRLRLSTENNDLTHVFGVFSNQGAELCPDAAGTTYTLLSVMPASVRSFSQSFDILNFDTANDPHGAIMLHSTRIVPVDPDAFTDERTELTYDFANNANGWGTVIAPPFQSALTEVTADGLTVRATANPNTIFTYWSSPSEPSTRVIVAAGRVYRVRFTVKSGAAADEKLFVPTIRLRVNDNDNRLTSYVNVESTSADSVLPVAGSPVTYETVVVGTPELAGSELFYAFDFLVPPGGDNDPTIPVSLSKLEVLSYAANLDAAEIKN